LTVISTPGAQNKKLSWHQIINDFNEADGFFCLAFFSFTNHYLYREALTKAAQYAKKLGIPVISLVFFIDIFYEKSREKYEVEYNDKSTGIKVIPIFIETGR
jgi:hypothetical protein